jgi:hypothetical protein
LKPAVRFGPGAHVIVRMTDTGAVLRTLEMPQVSLVIKP